MVAAAGVRHTDLRALAGIVNADRADVPPEGLPPSLVADLAHQIRCDLVVFGRMDSACRLAGSIQLFADGGDPVAIGSAQVAWRHDCRCRLCSYPERTGDLRSIVTIADFYSQRQWRSLGTRCGINDPMGFQRALMLTLPAVSRSRHVTDGTMRLFFFRGSGHDFSERHRAVLTLLRPHIHRAFLDAESRRHPVPSLTPRQAELLRLVATGRTNATIARQLGISEGTVRIHLEHIYARLDVSSRIAAVNRAFPPGMPGSAGRGDGLALLS